MGKFDGILLCTDFDQTLAEQRRVSPENAAAIRYFQENGGRFTMVSGRHPRFLKEHQQGFRVNAPLVGYNGALIMEEDTERVLYDGGRQDLEAAMLLRPYWDNGRILRYVIHDDHDHDLTCVLTNPNLYQDADYMESQAVLPIYNALAVCKTVEDTIALRDELNEKANGRFVVVRSWSVGLEVINPDDQKGVAIKRLKEWTGAKLLVAAGDFENDISMLKYADIGYAVGNAEPEVKAAADRVTVDFREHAMAAIVSDLDKEFT